MLDSQATAEHPAAASSRRRGPAAKARARARAAAHQATLAAAAQAALAPVATPGATSLPSKTSTAASAKEADVATPFLCADGDQEDTCDEYSGPISLEAMCFKPRKCTTDCGLDHWHKQFPGEDFAWAFSREDGSDVLHCHAFCPRPDGCPCCGPCWTA